MVQWPAVSPGTQGRIVEVKSSPGDMIAFTVNSSRKRRMREARSNSSSHDSYAISNLMTLAGTEKVTLM